MWGCKYPLSRQVAFTDTSHKILFFVLLLTNLNFKALSKDILREGSSGRRQSLKWLAVVSGSVCDSWQLCDWMASVNLILCSIVGHFTTKISSCKQRAASWVEGRVNWTLAVVCPHQLEPKHLINAWKRASGYQIKKWVLFLLRFSSRTAKDKLDSAIKFLIFSRKKIVKIKLKKLKVIYWSATVSTCYKFQSEFISFFNFSHFCLYTSKSHEAK